MLNKLKKILQWFVSVCFILSGLIYVGEYTVPAIVLMVLAGVIVLPPVTKKIPAFKFRKARAADACHRVQNRTTFFQIYSFGSHCAGYSAVRDLFCTGQRFLHSE